MAFSATPHAPSLLRPVQSWTSLPQSAAWVSFPFPRTNFNLRNPLSVRYDSSPAASASKALEPAISLTNNALKHLNKMRSEKNEELCLRIGVKQGGCSGMSYTMEFEDKAKTMPDDSIMEYDGFLIVSDSKSLLFLYGMQLDFSDALIGGGFSFKNPNATKTCGCGKSLAA